MSEDAHVSNNNPIPRPNKDIVWYGEEVEFYDVDKEWLQNIFTVTIQ